jgi:hypothetical protein
VVTDIFGKKEYQTMFDALVESVLEDRRLAVTEAVARTREEVAEAVEEAVARMREEDRR